MKGAIGENVAVVSRGARMSKRLLLLGASGLIGSELLTMARAEGWQLAAPSHAELDIGDREQVMAWVLQFSPDVILNAAGYTDVDGAESLPALNLLVNDQGAANLAFAAERGHAGPSVIRLRV